MHLSPLFLNTGTTYETFQQSGKQDSFRQILKSPANTHESSDSQFFRAKTGLQCGPGAFDESLLVMTFLTNLGVTEILCSFRLVLEGNTGKEIPKLSRLEYLKRFSAILLYQIQKTTPLGCSIEKVSLLGTILAIRGVESQVSEK